MFSEFIHGTKSYQEAVTNQLKKLEKDVPYKLEKALYLSPEQTLAFNSFNFVATGFYGVGKTTCLEVAIDRIVQMPQKFPNAKIIFVTWHPSEGLKKFFEEKFDAIRNQKLSHLIDDDSLEVFSLKEICEKYQVKELKFDFKSRMSSYIGKNRQKVELLNELCKKLKGNLISALGSTVLVGTS